MLLDLTGNTSEWPAIFFVFPVPNWEHFEKVTEVLSRVRLSVCPSVRLSVRPSPNVAPKPFIGFWSNLVWTCRRIWECLPCYSFFSLGQRSRSREMIYYHDPLCIQRKHARHFVWYVGHFWPICMKFLVIRLLSSNVIAWDYFREEKQLFDH